MFPLELFILLLLILLFLNWRLFRGDILSPVIIIHLSFIGASCLLLSGAKRLEIDSFSYDTMMILLTGICMFSFGAFLCRINFLDHKFTYLVSRKSNPYVVHYKPMIIPLYIYICFVAFSAMIAYIQFKHEVSYVGYAGAFTEIVSDFRDDEVLLGVPQNPIVSLSSRIIYVIQPILLFFTFFNRIVCGHKIRFPILLFLLFIVYIVSVFIIAGSRGRIFSIIFQIMFVLAICYNLPLRNKIAKNSRNTSIFNYRGSQILIKSGMIVATIGIPVFYYVGVLQGKKYSDVSIFEPVENYFSYGLIHLDHIVKTGVYETKDFGGWSFAGIYGLINKLGADYPDYDHLPFYERYGNTLTLFGRWYNDFGVIGVMIMSFLVGIIFSWIYYKMIYAKNLRIFVFYSVAYVFFMDTIMMASYDDWVKGKLALNGFFQIALMILLLKIIEKIYKKNETRFLI